MTTLDCEAREAELDLAFERNLLESARSDQCPPAATNAAWVRFSVTLASTTALCAGASVSQAALTGKLGAALAAKWLVIGAITGSSITAALMYSARPSPLPSAIPAALRTSVSRDVAPPEALLAEKQVLPPPDESARSRVAPSIPPRRDVVRGPRQPGGERAAASPASGATGSTDARRSTLAAQVALLDAARTANSAGATADALRLIDKYHRDFPEGELAADAEVVAIEALAANRDHAAVNRRARRFLGRHPNDPHAGRVASMAADAEQSASRLRDLASPEY